MSLPICEATHPETGERCSLRHLPDAEPSHYTRNGGSWPNDLWTPPPLQRSSSRSRSVRSVVREVDRSVREAALSDPTENTVGLMSREPRDTQRDAAYAVMPRTGTQRRMVLDAICGSGRGMTDEELRDVLGTTYSKVGPRRRELVDGGWVADSGQRRPTSSGQDAIVWVLTPEGRARLS